MAGEGTNPLGWLWGGGGGGAETNNGWESQRSSTSTQDWGLSLPQLHSLTAMPWWGKSEENSSQEELPDRDAVQRVFTEADGQRPNVPTQEFQDGGQMQQHVADHLDYEDEEEEDEFYEDEPEIEFSNLVDNHGNRLPMFSQEYWAFKQDEYLYIHHELPGETVSSACF